MNILSQQAKNRERIVKFSFKNSISKAAKQYGCSRASIYRWIKRYDGTWQSLLEKSHRPKHHPNEHTPEENRQIMNSFYLYERYGYDGVYDDLVRKGYQRSFSGMIYAIKRLGFLKPSKKHKSRKTDRRYPELLYPGEKVQIDVKEVPFCCLRGDALHNDKHFYQWTAIDECTRYRYVYAFEEHTPENTVKFLGMLTKAFPFKIKTIQTDNGAEFTYKFISDKVVHPMDHALKILNINHKLIPPRTPWHNGKVERSHRNDQRYFYDWETFRNINELNTKLKAHLEWSNNKTMRTLGRKSPIQMLNEKLQAQLINHNTLNAMIY